MPLWEDEAHVMLECPAYNQQTTDMMMKFSAVFKAGLEKIVSNQGRLEALLSCQKIRDFTTIAKFVSRTRQRKRKLGLELALTPKILKEQSFHEKRDAWRNSGRRACRHGVLFADAPGVNCPCVNSTTSEGDWHSAAWMPAISEDLKALIAVKFEAANYKRLGVLQAELRRRQW